MKSNHKISSPLSSASNLPNASAPPKPQAKQKIEMAREALKQAHVHMISSLEQITTIQQHAKASPNTTSPSQPTCPVEPPTQDAFKVRQVKGKSVRDVWVDTHDLINEPGGFIINLTKHGGISKNLQRSLRIHLGIRQSCSRNTGVSGSVFASGELVYPGTISATDDYAREIFREIRSRPDLQVLYALLEINDAVDPYELKKYEETSSPEFLRQFIQTYPTMLTKFHVEMPGMSGVYIPEWKFLLEEQTNLEELICNFGVVMWYIFENVILKNCHTLRKIILRRLQTYDVTQSQYVPMDWAIFTDCTSLTYLKVSCGFKPYTRFGTVASPPNSVFLHENFDTLPKHDLFKELHLERIWVDSCKFQEFSKERPNLKLCLGCLDKEYFDGESSAPLGSGMKLFNLTISKEIRVLKLSRVDFSTEILPAKRAYKKEKRKWEVPASYIIPEEPPAGTNEGQLAKIVLVLFIAILFALAMLFVIIYFRHLRLGNGGEEGKKVVASHNVHINLTVHSGHGEDSSSSTNKSLIE